MTNGKNSLHPGDVEIFPDTGDMVINISLRNLGGHVSVNFLLDPTIALAFAFKLLDGVQEIFKEQKSVLAAVEEDWIQSNLNAPTDFERGRFYHYMEAAQEYRRIFGLPEHGIPEEMVQQKEQMPEPKLDSPLKLCVKCGIGHMVFQSTTKDGKQEAFKCKCGHMEILEVP